jgi:hypothetical protein
MCYLAQWYCIPYLTMLVPLRNLYRQILIPYNGGGFSYAHAITPRGHGLSLHTPLKDLWALNMTLLGADFDLEASHEAPLPVMGPFAKRMKHNRVYNDMTPSGHKAYGAFVILEDHAPRRGGKLIDLSALPAREKRAKRRNWFYNTAVEGGYRGARTDVKTPTSLEAKLVKLLSLPESSIPKIASELRDNVNLVRKMATPAVWNTSFRLMFNALPFDQGRLQAKMVVTERPVGSSPATYTCHLCGTGMDSATHVLLECEVVIRARIELNSRVGTAMGNTWPDVLLAYPRLASPVTVWLTVNLTYQVWRLRREHFATLAEVPTLKAAIRKVVDVTLLNFSPEVKGTSRREGQVVEFATDPPSTAVVGFTDGSAYPSGESGAGITIQGGGLSAGRFRCT